MSVGLRAVQWNRDKVIYDAILVGGVVLYIGGYLAIAWHTDPPRTQPDAIDLWIRASGAARS